MLCPNCNANLPDGSDFCIRCGSTIKDEKVIKNTKQYITNDQYDLLLKSFVGEKYNSFVYKSLSFLTLFFGPFYMVIRKCYFLALISIISTSIAYNIGIIIDNNLGIIFSIIVSLYYAFTFNKYYIGFASKKVKKITEKNRDKDFVMLQQICSKKGGINKFLLIIFILLLSLLSILLILLQFKVLKSVI